MILLIHDLRDDQAQSLIFSYEEQPQVVANGDIQHCLGCFGCWTKEPGRCVLKDEYRNNGALMGQATELHIVSRCCYGGFSPFVKNVLDRSISYVHPDFRIREGRTHHRLRYDRSFKLKVWFYGDSITEKEKATAKRLVHANALNMGCTVDQITFLEDTFKLVGGELN